MTKSPLRIKLPVMIMGTILSIVTSAATLPLPAVLADNTAPSSYEKLENGEALACINLGNALDAPAEGQWGYIIEDAHIKAIAEAGFEMVRLPVRWSAHTTPTSPYKINTDTFNRVDHIIKTALDLGLVVILDVHHFNEVYENPQEERLRFLSIWYQISTRYADWPEALYFEILNEPRQNLQGKTLDLFNAEALAMIRQTNQTRKVLIGGAPWNSLASLETVKWPAEDKNLIATFHYYDPHDFTHQGAPWENPVKPTGVQWGRQKDRNIVAKDFNIAKALGKKLKVPVILGEFGAYKPKTERKDRLAYYKTVREEAEKAGISWCVWNFASDFAAFNVDTDNWDQDMLQAIGLSKQ